MTCSAVELHRLHTFSYDTEDLRLARWGYSLRFRFGAGERYPWPNGARSDRAGRRQTFATADEDGWAFTGRSQHGSMLGPERSASRVALPSNSLRTTFMPIQLDPDDRVALLKNYQVAIAEGHSHKGAPIRIFGGPTPEADRTITVKSGAHSARRICPITDFVAAGMVLELDEPQLNNHAQLGRAIAHVIVKLSSMYVEHELVAFDLQAVLEGDRYEVLPTSLAIEASHKTHIPHRLEPHAHDKHPLRIPRSTS